MRQGSEKLRYHYTKRFKDIIIERTVNVPLRAGANHFDPPKELHTELSMHETARTKYKSKTQDVLVQIDWLILRQPSISDLMQT
ncbi:hypothetical protein DFH29DRAFT_926181, partial [Suillus ampliporus]